MNTAWKAGLVIVAAAMVCPAAFAGEAGAPDTGAGAVARAVPAAPQPAEPKLKVGEKAPDFSVPKPGRPEGSDEMLKLSDFQGKKNVLLAFYPKVFTGGCTKQMCGYRDEYKVFQDNDTEIMALSNDPQSESDRFKKENEYQFYVIGDASKKLAETIGIGIRSNGNNQTYNRSVVLVDKQGVIRYIDMSYNLSNDDDKNALYAELKKLKAEEAKAETTAAEKPKDEG